jgi:hypothetical protein
VTARETTSAAKPATGASTKPATAARRRNHENLTMCGTSALCHDPGRYHDHRYSVTYGHAKSSHMWDTRVEMTLTANRACEAFAGSDGGRWPKPIDAVPSASQLVLELCEKSPQL